MMKLCSLYVVKILEEEIIMIVKNDFPILEYSTDYEAVINPQMDERPFPRLCLMTFFEEVLESLLNRCESSIIGTYLSEMKKFHVYKVNHKGTEICVIQAVVGSGSIAMMTDWLYGKGVEILLCCGSCGVLADIPSGDVVIPTRALRDEGASYKYLPPSRYIDLDKEPIQTFEKVLKEQGLPYVACTTWSTDGFYRETKEMIEYRVQQECKVVEMECAAQAAIAKFRNKKYGQLLYSGDILVGSAGYDNRNWRSNMTAREIIFQVTLEALIRLNSLTNQTEGSQSAVSP